MYAVLAATSLCACPRVRTRASFAQVPSNQQDIGHRRARLRPAACILAMRECSTAEIALGAGFGSSEGRGASSLVDHVVAVLKKLHNHKCGARAAARQHIHGRCCATAPALDTLAQTPRSSHPSHDSRPRPRQCRCTQAHNSCRHHMHGNRRRTAAAAVAAAAAPAKPRERRERRRPGTWHVTCGSTWDVPKSASLRSPLDASRRFSGFMSLWISLFSCIYSTPARHTGPATTRARTDGLRAGNRVQEGGVPRLETPTGEQIERRSVRVSAQRSGR